MVGTGPLWETAVYALLCGGLGAVALLYLVCISAGGVDLIRKRATKRRGPSPRHMRPRRK